MFVLGDGGRLRESVCTSGLHPVCAGATDLSHSTDTTVKRLSSKRPGTVLTFVKASMDFKKLLHSGAEAKPFITVF